MNNQVTGWNSVFGHTESIEMLQNMLSTGRMPHALLFVGPEGVGKMKTAAILAEALLCHAKENKPCGQCTSCQKFSKGVHPDFLIVRPQDAASIKIEQIRLLQQAVVMAPYLGTYKVLIIEAAETMTTQAANSLLKVLEEPSVNVVFVLIATRRHLLLDTIVSRCRTLTFKQINWTKLTEVLIAEGVQPKKAELAARLASGRIGAAKELLSEDGLVLRNKARDILFHLPNRDICWVFDIAAELDKYNRQEVILILEYVILIMRDIIMLSMGRETASLFNIDLNNALDEQCVYWQEHGAIAAIEEVRISLRALEANANIRLTIEAMLIKLMDLLKGG